MFANDDDMVECPYNNAHRMLRKRLQSHLLKCRVHYPDVELRKCPFNTTHLIPEPEFTHHVTNCSDRKLITQYKYDAPEQKEEEQPQHAPIESEENWDDTDVADYDPVKYVEKASVIRRADQTTPSERKEFIKQERKRLGDADSDEDDNGDNVVQVRNTENHEGRHYISPINHRSLSRDSSPTRPYRNASPMRRPTSDDRRTQNSDRDTYNRHSHSSRRDRSPKRRRPSDDRRTHNSDKDTNSRRSHSHRDRSPKRRRPDDRRIHNTDTDNNSRHSHSYRDRSPNDNRISHNKNHSARDRYRQHSPQRRRQSHDRKTYNSDNDPYYNSRSDATNENEHGTNRENPGPRTYFTANYNPKN